MTIRDLARVAEELTAKRLRLLLGVVDEWSRACEEKPALRSAHEGYAVLQEEVDELWEVIKRDDLQTARALRFLDDVSAAEASLP